MALDSNSLDEGHVRAQARMSAYMNDDLFGRRCRVLNVRVTSRTLAHAGPERTLPAILPRPSEYIRWVSEAGFLEPFTYLHAEWVWRPVIRHRVAGSFRAGLPGNILLFEREIADQLDDLERSVISTIQRTRTTMTVEVVVPHVVHLRLTCNRIRWRAYDHRTQHLDTVYLDVPDRLAASESSREPFKGPILLPSDGASRKDAHLRSTEVVVPDSRSTACDLYSPQIIDQVRTEGHR